MRRLIDNLLAHAPAGSASPPAARLIAQTSRVALFTLVYFLAARLSLIFALPPGVVTPFWLPSALALSACLVWGLHMAPAALLGEAVASWSIGQPPAAALMLGFGCAVEVVVATLLIRRFCQPQRDFIYPSNIFRFIGIAVFSSLISASISAASLAFFRHPAMSLPEEWLTWWLGDASGMVVGVPLLLAWYSEERIEWTRARTAEAVAFAFLLPIAATLAFTDVFGPWSLVYLPLPFLIWAAFRFKTTAVVSAIAAIWVIALWHTVHGRGPFALADTNTALLLLMTYIGVLSTTGLLMASLLHQRNRAERRLMGERDELEQRVRERTEELSADIAYRKQVEQKLSEAQRLAQIGSWNWEKDGDRIAWSDELYRIFGVRRENFAVTPAACIALVHEGDRARVRGIIQESARTGKPFHVEHRALLPDGGVKILASRGEALRDDAGRVVRVHGTVQDITEAKTAEAALREAEERYRMVVELSPDAILVLQDGLVVFANRAACALLLASGSGRIVGRSLREFLHPDCHALSSEQIAQLQRGQTPPAIEMRFLRLDGSAIEFEVNTSPFLHQGRFAALLMMRDITERKKTLEQMAYLAHYDSLTGLPNRMLFHQRLEHALSVAERPGRTLEILFLDLDRFKNINDTLGHATGDLVLQEAATRLQSILRESDTVARLGGDEFVVLVENVDEPHQGGVVAEKILAAFQPPFLRERNPLTITASIGIGSFPADGSDAETLLKKADIAMYRAKETGRNTYRYYSAEMNLHTTERLALEYALSHALERDQLSLYYQPKVDVASRRIVGMEALLRWQHPTLGVVPPGQFIGLAEETGLIRPIGYWAIRTACAQNKLWQQNGRLRLKVAVNLSPRQLLDDRLIDNIREILDETELEPRYLELEITESAVMENPDQAIATLTALHQIGISVAIDDFGIGYSSLAYLKRFPIRAVKIDQSFVRGIPANPDDSAITKAIIGLAHSLECSVIAEGAETRQQYDFLREHDCDSVQGFYFGAPMNAESFGDLLKAQSGLHLH